MRSDRTHPALGLALCLVLALPAGATPVTGALPVPQLTPETGSPVAPGIPPSRHGWQYDLEVATRLLESGYLSQAQTDFEKILTSYPDNTPAMDRAWLGLAKVHQARGDVARARSSLQEVLRRDLDPGPVAEARQRYRVLYAEAEIQINEARRAVFYYEDRLARTSWLNPFGKLFHWLDARKAGKYYDQARAELELFDPRFLIEPVAKPPPALASATPADGTFTLTAEEMQALLNQQALASTQPPAGVPSPTSGSALPSASGTEVSAILPSATSATPSASVDIEDAKRDYLATYQTLREALGSGDNARIQAASTAYQRAKEIYESARTANYQGR